MMPCNSKRILKGLFYVGLLFAVSLMVFNIALPYFDVSSNNHVKDDAGLFGRYQQSNRESNDRVIGSLQHQIEDLRKILETKSNQLESVKKLNVKLENAEKSKLPDDIADIYVDGDRIVHYIKDQINRAETLKGTQLRNEYDVNQFTMFDRNYIYQLDTGLKMHPQDVVNSRIDLARELDEVRAGGVRSLNDGPERSKVSPTYRFTEEDFLYGLFRSERQAGTEYELVYKPISNANMLNRKQLFKVTLFRPFSPVELISTSSQDETATVYFIVPLQGRADTFRIFVDYFKDFAVSDGNVHLTVVYYGDEELSSVEKSLAILRNVTGFGNYKVVNILEEEFSRGQALQHGVDSLNEDNPLMFFCDVDIGFTKEILNQCRTHAVAGKSVFYPIVFSLYNPAVVYKGEQIPTLRNRQVIKNNNGLWRDFGFGMSCQYLSEFRDIGGFDLSIKGWGSEDTLLYRRYTQSKIMIVRTPVNTLFHHWHPKDCDKSWATEQYESCLRSRARTEGSQLKLGIQYLELKERLNPVDRVQP